MADEVILAGISVQLINDLYLLVDFIDVLRPFVLRNLNLQIPVQNEFATLVQLVQLQVQSVHERAKDDD